MNSIVWPNVSKSLSISKDKISVDPVYLLLLIEERHPEAIDNLFLKKYWQTEKILCSENLELFAQLLWNVDKMILINHPVYVYIMKRLVDTKLFKEFWKTHVNTLLDGKVSKIKEMITINAAISMLKNTTESSKEVLKLFTENFLKVINDHSAIVGKDEDSTEIYKEFYDLLDQHLQNLKKQETKLQALRAFTQLSVEKNSVKKFVTNLINSLELEGLKEAVDHIKEIITGDGDDKERQYAATVLQRIITTNKLVNHDIEWRTEQLIFFANLAFLNSINGSDVNKGEKPSSIANAIRNLFYHSLESKFPKMEDEKKLLLGIVQHISQYLNKKDSNAYFQKPFDKKYIECWNRMLKEATIKPEKKEKKLKLVFHVLMLHMALQLFNNPELAENAIEELEAVMERATQKKKKENENEPEWIEVTKIKFI